MGAQLTRAVVAIVVARLLTPDEYGLAALALVFASLVMVFSDLALGAALIQRKDLSAVDTDTAFWTTLAAGVIFTVLGVALSGPLASLYGEPDAQPLLLVLSLIVRRQPRSGATQQNLMLRDMDFRRVEVLPMIAGARGRHRPPSRRRTAPARGRSSPSRSWRPSSTTALVWQRSPWRPRFAFSRASLRSISAASAPTCSASGCSSTCSRTATAS